MKRPKTKKKPKHITHKLFFFNLPIYDREICVVVGMTHSQAVAAAKKQKCTKSFVEALNWESAKELCDKVADRESQAYGAAVRVNDDRYFLFLRPYKNDWKYLDTLNHECFHLTQFISMPLKLWDDVEPPAYLHAWLVKQLRRILSGQKKLE